MAARGARAAAGDAGDRVPQHCIAGRVRTAFASISGLKEAGYIEGENVAIDYCWAENQGERLPAFAADLVRRQVSVIAATGGSLPAVAAKAATKAIPIVFGIPEDPVRIGLVESRPTRRQRDRDQFFHG